MQYQVPQFINIQDKIIGPLTLKQFLWLLAGAGILFIVWTLTNLGLFIVIATPISGFFIALAFLKVNEHSFASFISSAIGFYSKPKLYLWRRKKTIQKPIFTKEPDKKEQEKTKTASKSNIQELAERLDSTNQ